MTYSFAGRFQVSASSATFTELPSMEFSHKLTDLDLGSHILKSIEPEIS
jgi:hypothetical protein